MIRINEITEIDYTRNLFLHMQIKISGRTLAPNKLRQITTNKNSLPKSYDVIMTFHIAFFIRPKASTESSS